MPNPKVKKSKSAVEAVNKVPAKKNAVTKPAAVKSASKPTKAKATTVKAKKAIEPQEVAEVVRSAPNSAPVKLTPFLKAQREKLLQLRDEVLDSMNGVARDTLRSRAEGSEASAFGMHQADAGSDAYDRDFALSLISQEQDALYEIDEALKRIELGTYGVCEMSGKPIPQARLEALPFARLSVECQSQVEKQRKLSKTRQPVTSLFGLTDEEGGESDDEEVTPEQKD